MKICEDRNLKVEESKRDRQQKPGAKRGETQSAQDGTSRGLKWYVQRMRVR